MCVRGRMVEGVASKVWSVGGEAVVCGTPSRRLQATPKSAISLTLYLDLCYQLAGIFFTCSDNGDPSDALCSQLPA